MPLPATKALSQAKPITPRGNYNPKADVKLPKPLDDPARRLIEAAFHTGECVCIAQEQLGEDGRGVPKDSGATLDRETWINRLTEAGGDPNQIWSSTERTGAYIRVNPLKAGGSRDNEVTSFRHVLLEFDKSTVQEQWAIIQQSNVPCTAVLHSGNRSLHAWVRVDAQDYDEYRDRVRYLFEHFHEYQPDEKNKNPSRLSRLPGMIRGSGRQELLALKIGARRGDELSWDEWVQTEGEGLPRIQDAAALLSALERGEIFEPAQIIAGILHQGHKLVLGGGSKTNKSWALIALSVAVATGGKWLEFPCLAGNVLYLNFEIDEYHFTKRLQAITLAIGAVVAPDSLQVWNLRGHTSPYSEMIPAIKKHTRGRQYTLIILDPLYKLMGTADENKATDINQLLNAIESLAQHTGAATAFGAHFSKGNQAGKESIDRISGSGVFARDPDTIMMLTRHEEDDAFVVDVTLRNFKAVKPFGVRWEFPLLKYDGGLDPKKLKQPGHESMYTVEQLLEVLTEPLRNCDLYERMKEKTGITEGTFNKLLKRAVREKHVNKTEGADKVFRYERHPF